MALMSQEITSSTHAAFIPEIWADDTQDAIEFKEVLSKLVNTSFESQMSIGRILHIPHRSNLTKQTKTEGIANTLTFQSITQTNQDVTVSTYEYSAVLLNAVVQAQSKYNDRVALAGKMGYALVRGMEVTIGALFASLSQIVGTYGSDTDDSVVRRAWQYLADGGFYDDASWVFSPGAAQSLFGQDRFVSRDFQGDSGPNAIQRAKLPDMYNFPAYVCNLLTSPATNQHDNALIHKTAEILVRQIKPTAKSQYRIEYNADAMLMFDLYTAREAEQPSESPVTDNTSVGDTGASTGTGTEVLGDSGGVWVKGL